MPDVLGLRSSWKTYDFLLWSIVTLKFPNRAFSAGRAGDMPIFYDLILEAVQVGQAYRCPVR